ncbi:MAG: hypothetical protein C0470_15250 [Verminephrobacter sp.]|nr:hypothetical protein [Verminephrobacter sp.]
MSQITRCPACSTQFKVVADQLRISDGWVRCGHCAEVFDASESLVPASPPALLPDVSLTDVRPPPMPVARADDSLRAWGAPPAPVQKAFSRVIVEPDAPSGIAPAPLGAGVLAEAPFAPPAEVLSVPDPVPPALLTAEPPLVGTEPPPIFEPAATFAWKGADAPSVPPKAPVAPPPPPPGFAGRQESRVLSPDMLELVLQESPRATHSSAVSSEAVAQTPAAPVPQPGGYELPYAEDFADTPLTLEAVESDAQPSPTASQVDGVTATSAEQAAPTQPLQADVVTDGGVEGMTADGMDVLASLPALPAAEVQSLADADESVMPSLPSVEFPSIDEATGVKEAKLATPDPRADQSSEAEDDEEPDAAEDVSFVKAARRRAFWRKPLVRSGLVVLGLVLATVLAAQVAVHERNRLAAVAPQLRPLLLALCEPLGCELAPLRQIAEVVIDSSSFNKARGDSYVLAVTTKSRSTVALEMPAVELTLTDAQDQPVLRRVLLPTEMGAPQELAAGGEWSASVSVLVTTGGARVAGYRLLAFYP